MPCRCVEGILPGSGKAAALNLDWNNLEVRIVSAGYSLWESGVSCSWTWRRRVIPDNDLWIFDTGKCVMQMVGGKTPLNKDSIIWMRPGHIYDVTQDPRNPIGHYYIHFDLIDSRGQRFFPTLREMPETLHSFNMTQWRQMGQDIVRILKLGQGIERNPQRLPDAYRKEDNFAVASAMLKGLLMSLDYYNILRPAEKEPSLRCNASTALQAAVFIEESSNHFVEVAYLAKKFGLSRNRFTKIFTEYWLISPRDYLINSRISRAKRLLADTSLTVSEIAARLGYSDHYFFARQFKEKTGESPGRFRKEHRREYKSD